MKYLAVLFIFLLAKAIPADAGEWLEPIEAKHKDKKKKYKVYEAPKQAKFKESQLAHTLLDGKRGIEIGGSIHNAFGLNTLNVDYTDDINTAFKQEELKNFGEFQKVDIVSAGDDLPFKDNVWDFVINAHVLEHFYDPIKSVKEWLRVVKPGGYVFMMIPHKERTFDRDRPRTTLAEIVQNHSFPNPPVPDHHGHYSVWITQDFIDICDYYGWPIVAVQDTDDKVGNGFTIVIQKPFPSEPEQEASVEPLQYIIPVEEPIVEVKEEPAEVVILPIPAPEEPKEIASEEPVMEPIAPAEEVLESKTLPKRTKTVRKKALEPAAPAEEVAILPVPTPKEPEAEEEIEENPESIPSKKGKTPRKKVLPLRD